MTRYDRHALHPYAKSQGSVARRYDAKRLLCLNDCAAAASPECAVSCLCSALELCYSAQTMSTESASLQLAM